MALVGPRESELLLKSVAAKNTINAQRRDKCINIMNDTVFSGSKPNNWKMRAGGTTNSTSDPSRLKQFPSLSSR